MGKVWNLSKICAEPWCSVGIKEEIPAKRMRTFEHEVGIWSSIFYVPYPNYKDLCNLLEPYMQEFKTQGFYLCEDFHISLSKTLILKHFMINSVFLSMKPMVFNLKSAECFLAGIKPYQNDEKTTSFLALTVAAGINLLDRFVDLIDQRVCDIYKLPKYYTDRDYHMSLFWKNGPIDDQHYRMAKRLDEILDQKTAQQGNMFFSAPYDDLLNFDIEEIVFKSGCKLMLLPLANDKT